MPFVNQRWLGGMLTNFKTIRQSIKRLRELTELAETGALDKRGKKEALKLRREMDKLESSLGGIKQMDRSPTRCSSSTSATRTSPSTRREARHPGGRGRRHQLLARRHRLRDPGQR